MSTSLILTLMAFAAFATGVVGARLLMFLRAKPLRIFFSVVVLIMAVEMIYKGLMRW
jgi:uncharacterized membrane protein YfcA